MNLLLSILLGSTVVGQTPQVQDIRLPSGEPVYETKSQILARQTPNVPDWVETSLVKEFGAVDAPVVMELTGNLNLLNVSALPNDRYVAAKKVHQAGKELYLQSGAYVIRESIVFGTADPNYPSGIYSWMSRLKAKHPTEFKQLVTTGLDAETLDSEARKLFGIEVPTYEHESDSALQTRTLLRVCLVPRLIGPSAEQLNTGTSSVLLDLRKNAPHMKEPHVAQEPFINPKDGELDFGSGEVLSVGQFTARAIDQFGIKVDDDIDRFSRGPIFAKGKFTKERVEAVLQLLAGKLPDQADKKLLAAKDSEQLRRVAWEQMKVASGQKDSDLADPLYLHKFGLSTDAIKKANKAVFKLSVRLWIESRQLAEPQAKPTVIWSADTVTP